MKSKIVLAAAIALLFATSQVANAAPSCVKGTLESYIALGAGGCIFDNALYSEFTYAAAVTGGTTATGGVTPEEIVVTPILLPTPVLFPGLNFSAPWLAAAGDTEESVIGYRVVPYPPVAVTTPPESGLLILDLGPSKVDGIIGSVTVEETVRETTTAKTANLEVFDICEDACRLQQTQETTITPVQQLQTTLVVLLTGGNDGVSLTSFATDYAFGPQPE